MYVENINKDDIPNNGKKNYKISWPFFILTS